MASNRREQHFVGTVAGLFACLGLAELVVVALTEVAIGFVVARKSEPAADVGGPPPSLAFEKLQIVVQMKTLKF